MEIIKKEPEVHNVSDYTFMFPTNGKFTVTVDWDAGDELEELADRYTIRTKSRFNPANPSEPIDPEEMQIFKTQLAALTIVRRKQQMMSEEQIFDLKNYVNGLSRRAGIQ